MPEPTPEIGRGGEDGERAGDGYEEQHELIEAEPKAKLCEHEAREHDLGESVQLAHEQRMDRQRTRQHP